MASVRRTEVGGGASEREREADRVCKVSGSACDEIRVLRS